MEGIESVQRARPNQRMPCAPVWPYSDCTATEISGGHSWKTKQNAWFLNTRSLFDFTESENKRKRSRNDIYLTPLMC